MTVTVMCRIWVGLFDRLEGAVTMMARMVIQNDFLFGICMIRGSEHTGKN